uniref:TSP1_CCN domain-containing protein n=1 Tax=Macrostomum lignano TaxID=282301 RepID=A0A1I8F5I7_9PLAT
SRQQLLIAQPLRRKTCLLDFGCDLKTLKCEPLVMATAKVDKFSRQGHGWFHYNASNRLMPLEPSGLWNMNDKADLNRYARRRINISGIRSDLATGPHAGLTVALPECKSPMVPTQLQGLCEEPATKTECPTGSACLPGCTCPEECRWHGVDTVQDCHKTSSTQDVLLPCLAPAAGCACPKGQLYMDEALRKSAIQLQAGDNCGQGGWQGDCVSTKAVALTDLSAAGGVTKTFKYQVIGLRLSELQVRTVIIMSAA